MSKSDPDSAIFMEDTEADVKRKIKKSFCPENIIEENPVIDFFKYFVMGYYGKWELVRREENGGNKYFFLIKIGKAVY